MSVNQVVANSYSDYVSNTTTKNNSSSSLNFDSKALQEINSESNEIDREEDMLLYEQFKSEGMLKYNSFDDIKEHLQAFPPLTAPGNVRRAYREALKNATPEEKQAAENMTIKMLIYKIQTGKTIDSSNNSVDEYIDYLNGFNQYFKEHYGNISGVDVTDNTRFVNDVINELSKYKKD